MSGDHDLERETTTDRMVGGAILPDADARVETVYDRIRELIDRRGWAQGRAVRGGRLSLGAAVDLAVGVDPESRAAAGAELARRGVVTRHLRELAGTANLVAWNDERARTMSEVFDLLKFASVAYPDD